jgi:Tfp pilus assembly protein PilF
MARYKRRKEKVRSMFRELQGDLLGDVASEEEGTEVSGYSAAPGDHQAPPGGDPPADADQRSTGRASGAKVRDTGWRTGLRKTTNFEMVSEGDSPPPRLPAGEHIARARELVQATRVEEATELYRSILRENPSNMKARNDLGTLYEMLGQHDLALEQFEAALKFEPENVEVLNSFGLVLGVVGRFDEGEAELRRAVRIAPEQIEPRASLGILFFRRGLYAEAEVELRWVCDRDPEHAHAFFYRGEALNRLGRYDEAMAALEHATVLNPENGKAFYTLGILYDRKHLPDEAAVMYRKARELLRT